MKYIIPHPPVPWSRAGLSKKTGRFYDTQVKNKVMVGLVLANQHNQDPIATPIAVDLEFQFKQPPSHKKTIPHTAKPDLDNLIKFILDAMKDVLIIDDKIITTISARKLYTGSSQTIITITEVS